MHRVNWTPDPAGPMIPRKVFQAGSPRDRGSFPATVQRGFAALAAFLLIACGDTTPPSFISPPSLKPNPNPAVPLAAIVSAVTDEPAELVIEISDGANEWAVPASGERAIEHERAVIGFRPGRKHRLFVSARDQDGNTTPGRHVLKFETAPLPGDFPPIETTVSVPERMEPGVTLFSPGKWPTGGRADDRYGLVLAVDAAGEVRWYYRSNENITDPRPLPNGNLLLRVGYKRAVEMDMLGNVVAQWHAARYSDPAAVDKGPRGSIPVQTETFHHEIQQMPSGNLLTLSTEMRRLDYPTEVKPGAPRKTAHVVGDVGVEFARDGSIVNEWKLMDMLDPERIGYDSLLPIWDWAYPQADGGTKDWSHGNSVFYDSADNSIIVSLRHQDAVVKFSRDTGRLVWILGTHKGWRDPWKRFLLEPQGPLEWPYHQHAAKTTVRGTVMLFDNGNARAWPFDAPWEAKDTYSRAVEYAVDVEA